MLCMLWVLTMWLGLGCGGDNAAEPQTPIEAESTLADEDTQAPEAVLDSGLSDTGEDCDVPMGFDWSTWGQPFFRTWCSGCHGADAPERYGAPDWLVFDTEAQVYNHRSLIRSSVLERQSMPLGGGLPEQESESLDLFLRCVFGP